MITVNLNTLIKSYFIESETNDAKDVIQRAENQYSQKEQPPLKFVFPGARCKSKQITSYK